MSKSHKFHKENRRAKKFQRAFLKWLAENDQRFVVTLRVTERTTRYIDLAFVGVTALISVRVWTDEIRVCVEWGADCSDSLYVLDVYPKHTSAGYICELCESDDPDCHETYRTREDLWKEHLYEGFLSWTNSTLASARWLRLMTCWEAAGWSFAAAELFHDEHLPAAADPGLRLLTGLKQLGGEPMFDRDEDKLEIRFVPLFEMASSVIRPENDIQMP